MTDLSSNKREELIYLATKVLEPTERYSDSYSFMMRACLMDDTPLSDEDIRDLLAACYFLLQTKQSLYRITKSLESSPNVQPFIHLFNQELQTLAQDYIDLNNEIIDGLDSLLTRKIDRASNPSSFIKLRRYTLLCQNRILEVRPEENKRHSMVLMFGELLSFCDTQDLRNEDIEHLRLQCYLDALSAMLPHPSTEKQAIEMTRRVISEYDNKTNVSAATHSIIQLLSDNLPTEANDPA